MENPQFYDSVTDFHLLIYLTKNIEMNRVLLITQYILTKQNEKQVRDIFFNILKEVKIPVKSGPAVTQQAKHPKEQEWIQQLTLMGFTATQAQEALWATSYSGIEAAIDFLSK